MCQTMTTTEAHPFEAAGLGKAPFRLVGVTENVYRHPGGTCQPGGTCDYCSTGILYEFRIRSADGRTFVVGSDCVLKIDRRDNRQLADAVKVEVARRQKAARQAKRREAVAREQTRIDAAFGRFDGSEAIRTALAAKPHPSIKGDAFTLLGYVEWMRANAGHSGRLSVARLIEAEDARMSAAMA
jgi:hypothetical protein